MPIFPATPDSIQLAARRLQGGELVAFPTETVYGLGANALDADAVAKIYALKGRPAFNPLIVHVLDVESARKVCEWNEAAQKLADAFWPGPLTLILPKKSNVPDAVSAQLSTVGVRSPAHEVARKLLQQCGLPLAAPSANRSNEISPTRAAHVARSLGDELWILDGGASEVGLESTVLDLSGETPTILRPGALGRRELEPIIGPVAEREIEEIEDESPQKSPGQLKRHYAPRARVYLFSNLSDAHFHAFLLGHGQKVGVIALSPTEISPLEIVLGDDPTHYAQQLYNALHELDDADVNLILIERPPVTSEWDAVRDRLERAAHAP